MPEEARSTNGQPLNTAATGSEPVAAAPATADLTLGDVLAEIKRLRQEIAVLRDGQKSSEASAPASADAPKVPNPEYRERLLEIGREYFNPHSGSDVIPQKLVAATQTLARAAAVADMCADYEATMWPVAKAAISAAATGYPDFEFTMSESGVMDALTVDDYYALKELQVGLIPPEDLVILRLAGVQDPDRYLRSMAREARAFLDRARRIQAVNNRVATKASETYVAAALAEGKSILAEVSNRSDDKPPKKRKFWIGIGKILKGAGVAAGNLLPVFTSVGLLPVNPAVGALVAANAVPHWHKILSSCGAGVGDICAGVGAIRGEG